MSIYNFSVPDPNPNQETPSFPRTLSNNGSILIRMTWQMFRSLSAAIFQGGVSGVGVGICAAAVIGVFIYVIGAIVGAVISIPFGFMAGVIGMALGGRRGWAIGGAASLAGPLLLYGLLHGGPDGMGNAWGVLFIAAVIAGLYGSGVGYWYGGRAQVPMLNIESPTLLLQITLYDIPERWRLLSMAAILLTFGGVVWDIYRFCTVGF